MKTPNSSYESRSSSSGGNTRRSIDQFFYSPRSDYSSPQNSSSGKSSVSAAARSVAGVFVACFTPPETKKLRNSDEFGSPCVSNASVAGSEGNHGPKHGIYGGSNQSTHGREPGSLKFTMDEIYKVTRNFSPSLKIGQGGFGTVYKGKLGDGTLVAIKRSKKSVYDKHLGVEFKSEIQT